MTVFQPFAMSALLIFKIFVPFALVAAAMGVILAIRQMYLRFHVTFSPHDSSVTGSFFAVVAITDVMSLNLFFFVQDYGSWKEIGVSISHFAGANAFILFHIILFGFYQVLILTFFASLFSLSQLLLRRGVETDTASDRPNSPLTSEKLKNI